jgi:hypothetical protein
LARGEEPVEFVLGEWACEPAEQEKRSPSLRHLAKWNPKRELEEWRVLWACELQKCPLHLPTAGLGTRILRYDQQPGSRIGGKLVLAPESASRQFGLLVGGLVKETLRGGLSWGGLLPRPPGVK